jgi:hypothetical protein
MVLIKPQGDEENRFGTKYNLKNISVKYATNNTSQYSIVVVEGSAINIPRSMSVKSLQWSLSSLHEQTGWL